MKINILFIKLVNKGQLVMTLLALTDAVALVGFFIISYLKGSNRESLI